MFATVASTIPPVTADRARIYFYRDYEPYDSLARPELYLNRAPAGVSVPGGVSYRDVAPGVYDVSVYSVGVIPNADRNVTLKAGDIVCAKVESLLPRPEPNGQPTETSQLERIRREIERVEKTFPPPPMSNER